MKVVFMGTPDFAVPAFERLQKEHEIVCVYTREPKISGRGNKLSKTPVHLAAEKYGIEIRTPKTLRNTAEQEKFAALKADVAVVAAYGLILPEEILKSCPLGCLNIHASLLPRWRGAAPIQRAIEAGDKKSGVTIMQVAQGLDTGDMLLKDETKITPRTTGGELHDKLADIGADLISAVLTDIKSYPPVRQNDTESCYAAKLDKTECKINFTQSTAALCRKIMAFSPYPGMFFEYGGERFKILDAEPENCNTLLEAGTVICQGSALKIACADGLLKINTIQRQGKKPMSAAELLRGFSFSENTIL